MSDLKPLHASWIFDLHNYMQGESETILKGFKEAGIVEAIAAISQAIYVRVENPFRSYFSVDCMKLFSIDCIKYYLAIWYFSLILFC